jgi:galactitol-specific phosphotransferase system IIB component
MNYQMEKVQKGQKIKKLLSDRIDELKDKIKEYHILIISAKRPSEKRHYERKKEWLISILIINEMLNEQFKSPANFRIHR